MNVIYYDVLKFNKFTTMISFFLYKKICLKEGEVWWKNCSNAILLLSRLLHTVCHPISSAISLQKFTVFIEMKPPYPPTLITLKIPEFINPLSPNIHIQILQTDLYTFPLRISEENLIKIKVFSLRWSFY